ncbi:NUDIX hydrolase [Rhodococcoides yunnanense]|uniref:NUDIX hydrolase n=1 Tax=Rhodococcoides yunnanense TaxID=278209 RepID=UPI001472E3A1|nr:NUDIX domain-containing protein [Rhodococcus yunnanensis]
MKPFDDLERVHIEGTLRWLEGTDDVYRRIKPATPPQHLVSYVVVVEPDTHEVYLVDHINAGLWLPTGGHVEPGEDPAHAAARELREELGIEADFGLVGANPLFLTVTRTVGIDSGHTDVSLWYVAAAPMDSRFQLDPDEFREGRWWSPADIAAAPAGTFDPHYPRFAAKLSARLRT